MTLEEEYALLANVKSITDRMDMVDKVFRALKVGVNMELVFKCGHSGLYFRGDYLRKWGKEYGIGLGPDPVSEVLNSDYDTALPKLDGSIKRIEQIMFGLEVTRAQVDALLLDVDQIEEANEWAIPALDDPDMDDRVSVIRPRQLTNPRGSALLSITTEWNRQKGLFA